MKYNKIKGIDQPVSEVSFGCMSLKPDTDNAESLIAKAIDGGINLFDTADLYDKGLNEVLLGKALYGRRKEVLVSTKVGNRWKDDGRGWDWCPRKDYILKAVDKSLQRLQTDFIDLYLLHGGTIDDPIDETIEAFERLIEMGKIRAYGLSSIRPNVIREYAERSNIAVVMTQYSLLDRRPEEATLKLLRGRNIGVMARGTLAGGLLADKPTKAYLSLEADEVAGIVTNLDSYLQEGRSRSESALRYVIDNPAVTTAVVGIRTQAQLDDAIVAADSLRMADTERNALTGLWKGNQYTEHR